ncbi:MAG: mercury methylation corrinoid protein HgcA [Syntrophales bacterium]
MNRPERQANLDTSTDIFPILPGPVCCPAVEETGPKLPSLGQAFVTGSVETPAGRLPRVSSRLERRDRWGAIKARWGVGRMEYTLDPGLYALGAPDGESPVLVSANYKLSFDALRNALTGRDAWILVLDTKGINVWCAAGKGTFGTEELVGRIESSGLKAVVGHRSLILPQLGAPGVAAHTVKKLSGFGVKYGPVGAEDLPAYLDAGCRATAAMRRKGFTLRERAVLIPIELVETIKPTLIIAAALVLLAGIGGPGGFWENVLRDGTFAVAALVSAVVAGAVLNPLLLPYLPGRAFATKGLWLGAAAAVAVLALNGFDPSIWAGRLAIAAWLMIIPAVTAYLAMNFTGASTYTSLSGVNREMRWALPLEIGMGLTGLVVWVVSRTIA